MRARTASQLLLFDGFCKKETEAGRDVFFGEKYGETPHRAGSGCLTRQRSDARTANSLNRASFGSPGARQGQVLLDALPEWSRRGLLPAPRTKCSGLTAMSFASRCAVQRKRAPCYSCTSPMLSSPTLPSYFAAGVASVFNALHHMWKAWCKQGKKVLVHGLLQRAPRLVGSSREG